MSKFQQIVKIRTRKLGLLIKDARLSARRTVQECASALQIAPEEYEAFEQGQLAPSLPQLEVLAFYLEVPLDHFWGSLARSTQTGQMLESAEKLLALRNRVIGVNLRKARSLAQLTPAQLAEKTEIPEDELAEYEMGHKPIPLPALEVLISALGSDLKEFADQDGPIGEWKRQNEGVQAFLELPPELQAFVGKPVNRLYLELAVRLSEMDVNKLRAVAEGLLEITY